MNGIFTKCIVGLVLFAGPFVCTSYAQQSKISGTVIDSASAEPLPGVNILVKGTSIGTASDADGNYSLTVPDTSNVLVFSFIGYKTREVQINGRTTIDVTLQSSVLKGEELVVVGYGTQRKSDLTGSISSVKGEKVSEIPTSSVSDALQGKVAGLQVIPPSGRPGDQPIIRIRGVSTLNNSSPLFVVDGVLLDDISFVNPNNVQSVEVLKDASATAIYGSRGANGVIVITTKQGTAGETQVTAKSYFGFQRVNNSIDLANAQQFATLANESAANAGNPPVFENPDQFGAGTDYQDLIFDDMAPIQNYNVTASGGNDNLVYSISGNYFRQDGVVRGSNLQRGTLRLNNQYFLSDNITFGHNIAFNVDDQINEANDLVNAALRADPTLPPLTPNGDFNNLGQNGGAANPAAAIAFNNNDNPGYRTVGDAYLNVNFLQNLNFKSTFTLDLSRNQQKVFVPQFFVSSIQQNQTNSLVVTNNNNTDYTFRNNLTYQRDWGIQRLKVQGIISAQKSVFENLQGRRINFPGSNPALQFLNAGATDGQTNQNGSTAIGRISYIFRGNYAYKDRYLFTGTYRIDGSSIFGENNRYGFFPSVGVGWVVSEEPFFNAPWVSNLKLRGSWGRVGNDKIQANAAIPTVTTQDNSNQGIVGVFGDDQSLQPGATITDIANPNLKFEEVEQYDIGLELGLFDSRLSGEVDYYHRETNNILVQVPIPASVGAGAPFVNAASVLNRGFELNLNWQDTRGDFSYTVGLVGSTIHNEVLDLGQGQGGEIFGGNTGNNLGNNTRTVIGQPIGAFYGLRTIGVLQDQQEIDSVPTRPGEVPGDLRFADTNGDGVITPDDRVFLGSPIPDYTLGINLSGSYKNVDLSINLDGQFGNQILNARRAARGFRLLNYSAEFLDRWTGPGTSNTEPRLTESGSNTYTTDHFLQDGDFLRIRNIQVGYSLPATVAQSLNLRRVRFYANTNNPVTFTGYTGYTPQIGSGNVLANGIDNGVFPVASSYTLGVQVDF